MLANFALSDARAPSAVGSKPISMELKQLEYFLGVAESGSFSKAAIRLSVAQPILSRQIKLLESELGVELLYRNGRGVVVSEAGKVLETYARSVVGLVEKAQSEIGSLKAEPRGRVAIAMPPSIGWMLTGPLVVRCRETFPQILLHIAEGFSGHVAEWLSTGRVDIGVVYQAPRLSTLKTEPLLSDELILLRGRRSGSTWGRPRPDQAPCRHSGHFAGATARTSRPHRQRAREAWRRRQCRVRGRRHAVDLEPCRARRRVHHIVGGRGEAPLERRPHSELVADKPDFDARAFACDFDPAANERRDPSCRPSHS